MKGNDIIDKARNDLKEFIFFEAVLILIIKKCKFRFKEDEDLELSFENDLETMNVVIPVEDNSVTIYETMPLKKIRLTTDRNVFFVMDNTNDDEEEWTFFSTDDLVKIANVLEKKYNELIK